MTLVETYAGETDDDFRAAMDAILQAVSPDRPNWWHPYEVRGTYRYGGIRFRDFYCVAGSVEAWIWMYASNGGTRRVIVVPDKTVVVFGGVTMAGLGTEVPVVPEQITAVRPAGPTPHATHTDSSGNAARQREESVTIDPVILDDDAFDRFLTAVIRRTVAGLKAAGGDEALERPVIDAYIRECLAVSMGPMEIHDYFSISHPGIVGEVADAEAEQDRLNDLYEQRMAAILREIE